MAKLAFKLNVISPMFLNGADTKKPEMRAASIRGQLRYWLRAILGARNDTLAKVWEEESKIFGSTGQGSTVSVRVFGKPKIDKHPMLPHREGTKENPSKADAISPKQSFDLHLVTRPGVNIPDDALYALQLWSLLGGVGKRSRRMMGAVEIRPTDKSTQWYSIPQTADELAKIIKGILDKAIPHHNHFTNTPEFPVLYPKYSWIIIGKEPAETPEEANREFFRELLRNHKFKRNQDVFGYAKGNKRRASPVHAQVRKIGDDYYPIITAFRSKPIKDDEAKVLRDFMQDASDYYDGIHVWGDW